MDYKFEDYWDAMQPATRYEDRKIAAEFEIFILWTINLKITGTLCNRLRDTKTARSRLSSSGNITPINMRLSWRGSRNTDHTRTGIRTFLSKISRSKANLKDPNGSAVTKAATSYKSAITEPTNSAPVPPWNSSVSNGYAIGN